jgi:hypothetical protein
MPLCNRIWRDKSFCNNGNNSSPTTFWARHALLLVKTRFLRPRNGRAETAICPGEWPLPCPQPRSVRVPVRVHVQSPSAGMSTAFPCRIRVHNLSVSCPRPRSRRFPCDFPATRLRHFPRESLIARLSSGEASIVKVELAGGRASLTLTTRSEPHNRRAIHSEPE